MTRFTKIHTNDSPTIHGLSNGAMRANSNGDYSEVQLIIRIKDKFGIKLSRREVRQHITGSGRDSEWHHVKHNERVVEMYFAAVPSEEDWEYILEDILEDRKNRKECRGKCIVW